MKLRVGTFNLYQFVEPPFSWYSRKDKFTQEQWQEKLSWIKEQIVSMNCDIIGFQEVFSKDALEELTKELGYQYFITVSNAKLDNNNPLVYKSTTVALASKYPILEIQKVQVHGRSIQKHKFKGHFKFSRTPIKALIQLPNKKQITVYVNHFKSNRLNEYEYIFNKNHTLEEKCIQVQKALDEDFSKALKQRLCETSSLFYDFKQTSTPIICLCDLNDKEFSISIEALTNKAYHKKLKKDSYFLYDANNLYKKKIYNPHPEKKEIKRTATSYFQSYANVLDYIFISKEFNKTKENTIAKVTSYEVFDKHLQKNQNGTLLTSDHAQVVCELEFK